MALVSNERGREERERRERRELERKQPATWFGVAGWAAVTAGFAIVPWWLFPQDPGLARLSPWPQVICLLLAIGFLCAFVTAWRGVLNGWTKGQSDDAGFKLGCWVFGVPLGIAGIWAAGSALQSCNPLSSAPWWAVVIIVLLVGLLFK
jgi:hypothetical protein